MLQSRKEWIRRYSNSAGVGVARLAGVSRTRVRRMGTYIIAWSEQNARTHTVIAGCDVSLEVARLTGEIAQTEIPVGQKFHESNRTVPGGSVNWVSDLSPVPSSSVRR